MRLCLCLRSVLLLIHLHLLVPLKLVSITGTKTALSAAQADYSRAMKLGADDLHTEHVDEWARVWRSGLEVGGRHESPMPELSFCCTSLVL